MFLNLFSICFKKLGKKETKNRIIILSAIALVLLVISVIVSVTATTSEDEVGGWFIIITYLLFFGWRLIADIILYASGKLEDK